MRTFWRLMTVLSLLFAAPLGGQQPIPQVQVAAADSPPWGGLVQEIFGRADPNQLMPPDAAFKITATATGPQTIVVQFIPAEGHYFYADKFVLKVQDAAGATISSIDWPRAEIKSDPFFGTTKVIERPAEAIVRLHRTVDEALTSTLRVEYQGCNYVVGVCYPPAEKTLPVALPIARKTR